MFNPNLLLAYIQKIGGIDKLQKRHRLLLASGPHRRNPRLVLPMQSHVEVGHIPIHLKRPKTDILSDVIQIIPQQEKRGEGGTSTKWNENQEIKINYSTAFSGGCLRLYRNTWTRSTKRNIEINNNLMSIKIQNLIQ